MRYSHCSMHYSMQPSHMNHDLSKPLSCRGSSTSGQSPTAQACDSCSTVQCVCCLEVSKFNSGKRKKTCFSGKFPNKMIHTQGNIFPEKCPKAEEKLTKAKVRSVRRCDVGCCDA